MTEIRKGCYVTYNAEAPIPVLSLERDLYTAPVEASDSIYAPLTVKGNFPPDMKVGRVKSTLVSDIAKTSFQEPFNRVLAARSQQSRMHLEPYHRVSFITPPGSSELFVLFNSLPLLERIEDRNKPTRNLNNLWVIRNGNAIRLSDWDMDFQRRIEGNREVADILPLEILDFSQNGTYVMLVRLAPSKGSGEYALVEFNAKDGSILRIRSLVFERYC